jgi:hypothetical protein
VSTGFDKYSDEQWEAIVATQQDWPPGIDWAEIRLELEEAGRHFWKMRKLRPAEPKRELRKVRRVIECLEILGTELPHYSLQVQSIYEPDLATRLAGELRMFRRRLDDWEVVLDVCCSEGFRGRADAHRESLYSHVLSVWTGRLGGELKFSRARLGKDPAAGPCVRFLTAALEPVLDLETPGPEGIASIINRERTRPKRLEEATLR